MPSDSEESCQIAAMKDPDQEYVESMREWESFSPMLKNWLRKLFIPPLNEHDTDDIISDTFIKYYDWFRRIAGSKKGWSYTTSKNLAIQMIRKRQRIDDEEFSEASVSVTRLKRELTPGEKVDVRERIRIIEQEVLPRLSEARQEVFNYKVFLGMDYDEISEITQVKVSTLYTRYSEARNEVIRILKEDFGISY